MIRNSSASIPWVHNGTRHFELLSLGEVSTCLRNTTAEFPKCPKRNTSRNSSRVFEFALLHYVVSEISRVNFDLFQSEYFRKLFRMHFLTLWKQYEYYVF